MEKEIFYRLAKEKEGYSNAATNRGYAEMPEKEGYEKVFKPYGNLCGGKGIGFYYSIIYF